MPQSEAKKAATRRYLATLGELKIRMKPEERDAIKVAAALAGESVNAYVLGAVRSRIAQETSGVAT